MREIIRTTFESGNKLPASWIEDNCIFEQGILRSEGAAMIHLLAPGTGYYDLKIEIEVDSVEGGLIICGDSTLTLVVDFEKGRHRVTYSGTAEFAVTWQSIAKKSGKRLVSFNFSHDRVSAEVDGDEVISARVPGLVASAGLFSVAFLSKLQVHRISVFGGEPLAATVHAYPARQSNDFHLEVAVDFYDDLYHGPWNAATFDALFTEFKSWGVKRCHWFYYGSSQDGWWKRARLVSGNAAKTMENVGEIFPAAVRAAHAHGIEIYGLVKPFDMGLFAGRGGMLEKIGGSINWITDFAAQRRDLIIARKPDAFGPAQNEIFNRIDLVKEDDRAASFTVEDIKLYVSDDNLTYQLYNGPISREETVENYPVWEHTASGGRPTNEERLSRVMRLEGLEIRQKYIVLAVDQRDKSFSNELINLVHVFGEKGEERLLTYGLFACVGEGQLGNSGGTKIQEIEDTDVPEEIDFRKTGVEFDAAKGTPSGIFPGFDAIRARHDFDADEGFLAFARGKDRSPIAVLSPSFPETREHWLSWLRACLDAGADGIELRMRNHHTPIAWGEYGFEKPVRDEFLKRYGVDLWTTDDFDKPAWRRLRGEAYTEFYRQAKKLASSYGKPLGIHVSPTNNMEPEMGAAMEIHWDWRTWIDEGLADSITMKEVWPRTRFAEEILSHTRPRKIPVIFCPYANRLWERPDTEHLYAKWINLARENGYEGFQIYEAAYVFKGDKKGSITMKRPVLRDVLKKIFLKEKIGTK